MMRLRDVIVFTPIAVGLHLAAFAALPPRSDEGAGDAGTDTITLMSSPQALERLVDTWDRSPEVTQDVATITPAPSQDTLPVTSAIDTTPTISTPPVAPEVLEIDLTPPTIPEPAPRVTQDIALMPAPPRMDQSRDAPPVVAQAAQAVRRMPTERPSVSEVPPPPALDTAAPTPPVVAKAIPKIRPKPRPTQTDARPALRERAKGQATSKSNTAGSSKTPAPSVAQAGVIKKAVSDWGGKVRYAIERKKFYPKTARGSGTVVVALWLSPSGQLQKAQIAESSGDPALDNAALSTVQRAKYPKASPTLTKSSYNFRIPIRLQR